MGEFYVNFTRKPITLTHSMVQILSWAVCSYSDAQEITPFCWIQVFITMFWKALLIPFSSYTSYLHWFWRKFEHILCFE